ncbi:response regulator [Candidatus Parcubacteria bacterium]|nr:MAG: response regulator [Candidatus Parcubacteria bacterium]
MRAQPLILIVDDEKNFLEIMSVKLKASGFAVETARDKETAIKKAKELKPDLILMDIHLGGEDGTEVALTIKQDPDTKDAKVAFLTALKEPWPAISGESEAVAKELGMDEFLEKSEDLDVLVEKIQGILQQ